MTVTSPTPRVVLRRNRAALLVGGGLVLVLVAVAVLTLGGRGGNLDPDAYDPGGSRALATLLRDRGIEVVRTGDVPSTTAAARESATVFVPLPELLSPEELQAIAAAPGRLVVAGGDPQSLADLGLGVTPVDAVAVTDRSPGCDLPAARAAGRVDVGGLVVTGPVGSTGCYRAGDGFTVLGLPDDNVVVGSRSLFTNDRLGRRGNAALAIGLLAGTPRLVWLVPDVNRPEFGQRPLRSADDLLPDWVRSARFLLVLVVLVLALWQGRRLGRVVPEPLPVVVRASETAEGRGRMYRAAGARGTAADSLRAAARGRLAPRLGAGANPDRAAFVALVAERSGRAGAEVDALLYGPDPSDDNALVRLADDLDTLTREVAGS